MLVGYARVSTDDQNLNLQRDALQLAGCTKIFEDQISGAKAERPGLHAVLQFIHPGDTLVVWRLDRLSRSLKDLIEMVRQLESNNIGLKSLQESIDTTSSSGMLIFHVFGALAEFERNLTRERTQAGLQAARSRGRKGGRPKVLNKDKQALAVQLYDERKHTVTQICELMGVSRPTLYKYIDAAKKEHLAESM
ncbi:recombinase family protein [Pantoea sp. BAV 3049]|uniref:recombinase family protein n=1 Tax=Pantoea sp. BAV 3049 TaxID=2654188 RepID=UPI00131C93FF|nr:recombinase family protein [Pantoea sp. BAV 3049]